MANNKLKLAEYYEFVRWFATPRGLRNPRTQGEFSELFGLHPGTLSEWKADPHFKEDVRRKYYEWTHDLVPDVVGAMYLTATKGDVKAQTLFMKYFSTLPNPDKPTPGELQATGETLADVLIARLKQRQQESINQNEPRHLTNNAGE